MASQQPPSQQRTRRFAHGVRSPERGIRVTDARYTAWLRNVPLRHRVEPVVRRLVLTILVLAVMLPSAAFAGVRYLCAMDGQVRSACCCPAKAHKQERRSEPQTEMRSSCCCKISKTTPTVTPQVRHEDTAQYGVAAAPVAVPAPSLATLAVDRAIAMRWIDPKPPKPDRNLFVRNCALLL